MDAEYPENTARRSGVPGLGVRLWRWLRGCWCDEAIGKRCAAGLMVLGGILAGVGIGCLLALPSTARLGEIEFTRQLAPAVAAVDRSEDAYRHAAIANTFVVVVLAFGLFLLSRLGERVFRSQRAQEVAHDAKVASSTGLVVSILEVLLIYPSSWPGGNLPMLVVQAAAFGKYVLLAAALPTAVGALVVTCVRLWTSRPGAHNPKWTSDELHPPTTGPTPSSLPQQQANEPTGQAEASRASGGEALQEVGPNEPATGTSPTIATHWDNATWLPSMDGHGGLGICVSGGGIRSACVTLGALQQLQAAPCRVLSRARFLVSVSGGGYTAGAYQLALTNTPSPTHDVTTATPLDVLAPGSVEEDHLRRHSNYVADNAREWVAALTVLLRGILVSLALITTSVALFGALLHEVYRVVPIVDLRNLAPRLVYSAGRASPHVPPITPGVKTAILVALALALVLSASAIAAYSTGGGLAHRTSRLARSLAKATGLLAVVGVGLPLVFWGSGRLTWSLDIAQGTHVAGGALGTVLVTYLGALVGVLWRSRRAIGKQVGGLRARLGGGGKGGGLVAAVPSGIVQRIIVGAALLGLIVVFLLVLGWTVTTAERWSILAFVIPAGLLFFFAVFMDQTWLSLHPFYRRRLVTAFAVRRIKDGSGRIKAEPYKFDEEVTRLSEYGKPLDLDLDKRQFPQLIFAAAANLSGSDTTPPGRRAVSFTLSHDWIGGPDVGWVRTDALERNLERTKLGSSSRHPSHIGRDLTVMAAVAISGAAFASAMGRQARAYQTFFALSNVRLGTWLPNPGYLSKYLREGAEPPQAWRVPRLPWLRRLPYLIREILGSFPEDNQLLFVSDGGHYENLGLVELLRRRCTAIYCIDASGDVPPLAATLSEAIVLANEELGVTISLDNPLDLVPGSADALEPKDQLAPLSGRLSKSAILTATIAYPATAHHPREKLGTLVVAKASLTGDMPYELLAYAASNPVFPRDSTADQWFDVGQFDAYQALGRYLGKNAIKAMTEKTGSPIGASRGA